MQDNNPKEFDEQFIDQAWLEMKQLLDKEMPVQPKRRVAGWLWLLAGLLLLFMLAGSGYCLFRSSDNPEPAASLSYPNASLDNNNRAETQGKNKGLPSEPEAGSRIHKTSHGSKPNVAPLKSSGKNASQKGLSSPSLFTPPLQPDEGDKEDWKGSGSQVFEKVNARDNTVDARNKKAAPSAEQKPWVILPALPSEQISCLSPPAEEEWPEGLPGPILSRRPGMLRLAVEGGAFFLGRSVPDGLSAGLALEARPPGKRFYWRAGAFLRWYEHELNPAGNELLLENSFSKDPQPDGSFVNRASKLVAGATINNSRYIQFPLLAGYQWKPRLAVEAGIQAGFLLNSDATSKWELVNEASSPGNPGSENNTIYQFKKGARSYNLNGTSLDAVAALAFRSSGRSSLRLSYQYGLTDILSSPRDKAYLRGLQLSLAWRLL